MNRNRALIALVVAIAIAVIASRFVYRQIQQASAVKPLPVSHIVVASRPLALGTPLTAQDVELIAWPDSTPLQGSFVRVQDCIGRSLITPISKNEPVLESKLAPKEAGVGLPAAIPVGMRAVSVRVDDVVGVSGFAMPGTMVDVLATGTPQGEDDSLTRNIIQDVRVLAAGQTVEQDTQGKPHTVGVVTLLLTPKQADQLTMASTDNRIHLALRNTIDTKIEDKSEPVFRSVLLLGGAQPHRVSAGGGKPRPRREVTAQRPAGPAPYVVEVIRGDKKTAQTFSGQ